MNDQAALDASALAGADWVGFVFFARSPRYVTPSFAAELSARSPGGPDRVGLFVDPTDDDVALALDALPLDALQIYAPVQRLRHLRAKFGVPVWQATGVGSVTELPSATSDIAAFVIEPRAPEGASRPGGLALQMHWPMLVGWNPGAPWLLAGGLTPINVARAMAASGARAVDVSSGVETAPGVKDPAKITAFVRAAHDFLTFDGCA